MLFKAYRSYLQVPRLCQDFRRFSGIVLSLVAGLQRSQAAVHECFCFSVSHNVCNLYIYTCFFFEWAQSGAIGNSGLAASSSSVVSF
jgi:hypothetical protein